MCLFFGQSTDFAAQAKTLQEQNAEMEKQMAQLKKQLEVTRLTCLCIKTKPFFTGGKKSSDQAQQLMHFLMFSEEADKKDKKWEFFQKSGRQPKFFSPFLGLLDSQY